jgi:hypothetical protein
MKQFFLLVFALCLFKMLHAQDLPKGTWTLGASTNFVGGASIFGSNPAGNQMAIGFGKQKREVNGVSAEETYTAINFSPNFGYFVANDLMIGLGTGLNYYKSEDNDAFTALTVLPMVRYYFIPGKNFRPFGQVHGGIGSIDIGVEPQTITLVGTKAGGAFFITPKASIDLFLDLNFGFSKEDNFGSEVDVTDTVFGFGVSFSYFL